MAHRQRMAISLAQSYFDIPSLSFETSRYLPTYSRQPQEMDAGSAVAVIEVNVLRIMNFKE